MRNVAVVWTELQQRILLGILLQTNQALDSLFVREGIEKNARLCRLARTVVDLPEVRCSVRSVGSIKCAISDLIVPEILEKPEYALYTWTFEHPYARALLFRPECVAANIFEDGTYSYVDNGWLNANMGVKEVLSRIALYTALWEHGGYAESRRDIRTTGWSLFPGAHPRLSLPWTPLDHASFRKAVEVHVSTGTGIGESSRSQGPQVVYLPSPYADYNLMTDEDEIHLHADALERAKSYIGVASQGILWKPHPRAVKSRERFRVQRVRELVGMPIELARDSVSIECFAAANAENPLQFLSLSSSSLYTLKALAFPRHSVACIRSRSLLEYFPQMKQLYSAFQKIGVQIVD